MNQSTSNQTTTRTERLFQAGAHFGFTKRRRHPTVAPYLYGQKDGNDIIDLEKTAVQIDAAAARISEAAKQGKTILYVGTKDEIKQLVQKTAEQVTSPYVVNRWIGGMLTNFSEIKKRIGRLNELEADLASGNLEKKYTKKERVVLGRSLSKLQFNFGGMQTLSRVPDLLVVVDTRHDSIAIEEARMMKIPTIGIMGSDSNVNLVDQAIVVNDALQSSVSLVLAELAQAHMAGAAAFTPAPAAQATRNRTPRPRATATARAT